MASLRDHGVQRCELSEPFCIRHSRADGPLTYPRTVARRAFKTKTFEEMKEDSAASNVRVGEPRARWMSSTLQTTPGR
jgi:hypothetical protein